MAMDVEKFLLVVGTVRAERKRQQTLKESGRFRHTLDDNDPGYTDLERLACVLEELAEVGKAILGESGHVIDGGDLDKELTQVAALSIAWLEGRLPDGF